jgi:hypothetical protein
VFSPKESGFGGMLDTGYWIRDKKKRSDGAARVRCSAPFTSNLNTGILKIVQIFL